MTNSLNLKVHRKQIQDMNKIEKPKLSFWQIWNMSFGFMGIQFGFALQNANTSRIFETLGSNVEDLAIFWLAAPVTGLIVQPIIGHYSDQTWHPSWGRRRPYFTVGAVLASIALVMMPNAPVLWMAVGTLWILDASINISMEPFRAFVGDMLPLEQRTIGFAMQTFFIGVGAVVGSLMPWIFTNFIGLSNTAPAGTIPDTVKYSFYIGAVVFFLAVIWTVISTREYPPGMFTDEQQEHTASQEDNLENNRKFQNSFMRTGLILTLLGALVTLVIVYYQLDKELYVLSVGLGLFGIAHIFSALLLGANMTRSGLVNITKDFNKMPKTMRQLALVQFFSWLALFSMWIYTTPAVARNIFGATDAASKLYNEGADWVTVMFGTYNGASALFAFFFPPFARATSRKIAHFTGLVCGGLGLISIYFMPNKELLLLSMLFVGFAWASILTLPYAILAGALPQNKMGIYMGIFNFFIVIPQIVAASILGFLLKNFFDNQAIYALIVGGISMLIASLLVFFVDDVGEKKDIYK